MTREDMLRESTTEDLGLREAPSLDSRGATNTRSRVVPVPTIVALALTTIALAACGNGSEEVSEDDPLYAEMEAAFDAAEVPGAFPLETYRMSATRNAYPLDRRSQVFGFLSQGERAANYTGWLKGDNASVVSETFQMGEYGAGQATYFYLNNVISYYRSEQVILDVSNPQNPRRRLVEVEAGFTPLGELSAYRKLVDGVPTEMDEGEGAGIAQRSDVLADSVRVIWNRGG